MNQILSTEMNRKDKRPTNIKSVTIVFGICLILFGICLTGGGSYAVYQSQFADKGASDNNNTVEQPPVNQVGESEADKANIEITLEAVENQIKATITSNNQISFVTYRWDNGAETRQDINNTLGEVLIDIPEGQHTLTIIAVDINNNTETKTQAVKGIKKPSLEVTQDGENFVVKMSDETGLDRVEFELNGQAYVVRLQGVTEREFSYPLADGQNTLSVTLYNTSGATQEFSAEWQN